jgi:alpha(1,3/1,4) fucosyltransferase
MKKKLKVAFTDFWVPGNQIVNDYLFQLLSKAYDLEISEDPDILFYSCFGIENLKYRCLKIFYTPENFKPDFHLCDYAFSFEPTSSRNLQLPNFVRHPYFQEFIHNDLPQHINKLKQQPKDRFCNFLYSNDSARVRQQFCKALSNYKHVDCPGKVLNNMPSIPTSWDKKLEFLSHYKFTIAFENQSAPGYTTEKIYHPLLVGSIPIYWGNPNASDYFNPDCFINCHDYESFDEVIDRVIEIDSNKELYNRYLNASPVDDQSLLKNLTESSILNYFKLIFQKSSNTKAVSKKMLYWLYVSRFVVLKILRLNVIRFQ